MHASLRVSRTKSWRLLTGLVLAGSSFIIASHDSAASASPLFSVSPISGLNDGDAVAVSLSPVAPKSTWALVECSLIALGFYTSGSRPSQDGCEQRSTWVAQANGSGLLSGTMKVRAKLTTAAGAINCLTSTCFVVAEELGTLDGSGLKLQAITFSSSACSSLGSCALSPDAWDPLTGSKPVGLSGAAQKMTTPSGMVTASATKTYSTTLVPEVAPNVTSLAPLTGFGAKPFVTGPVASSGQGEGVLEVSMAGEGTKWGASSVVANLSISDSGTHRTNPTVQLVLHQGASPFVYTCFVGLVSAGHHYKISVNASPSASAGGLSQVPSSQTPTIAVGGSALLMMSASNNLSLVEQFAPVMYGRSTSALHDVPLLVDATSTPTSAGGEVLSYTYIFSHEDAGTAFIPSLEWAHWGRLTDIETAMTLTLDAAHHVVAATYFSGGVPGTGYPDSDGALSETTQTFPLTSDHWWGSHPLIRDATGNNDFSTVGSTKFRFQLAAVPGPASGATRESVMGSYPFTYVAMSNEVATWYVARSTDPTSMLEGDATQYAVVEVSTTGGSNARLAARIEVGGVWYGSNYGMDYFSMSPGHFQTVVKLPLNWTASQVQGVQVAQVVPSGAAAITSANVSLWRVQSSGVLQLVPVTNPVTTPSLTAWPLTARP